MRVLLHGFLGSPESWQEVRQGLGDLAVDCPSLTGHAPGVPAVERFEEEVDRLASRVAELPESSQLIGYSLGGRLALGMLCRHPELWHSGPVESAVLIGAHPGFAGAGERARRIESDERWARRLEEEPFERFLEQWRAQPVFAGLEGRVPAERLERDARRRAVHDPKALARALRVLSLGRMPDWSEHLPELDLPIELWVGELDGRFRGLAATMAARLPRGRVVVIPGAGHNLPLEAPATVAARLVEAAAETRSGALRREEEVSR